MYVLYQRLTREPALNLALEEALLHVADDDIFMLWRDDPSVIVGRNQNALAEIDREYCRERGIEVVRRISGGGAVYHDAGNLCFTFIALEPGGTMGDHAAYTQPVIDALNRMGIPARREGRNDISVEGVKVSGNAQYAWNGRLCHHGTLLFNANLAVLGRALKPDPDKMRSKGIASVAARVGNLSAWLPGVDVDAFALALCADMLKHVPGSVEWSIPGGVCAQAERIAGERYRNPSWTYGSGPPYDYRNKARFAGGTVELLLGVEEGVIQSARVLGDFLSTEDIAPLTRALAGIPHERAAVRAALEALAVRPFLGGITLEEFLSLF